MRDGSCENCGEFTKVSEDGKDCLEECPTKSEYMSSDCKCQKCD